MPYQASWEPLGVALHFSGVVSGKDLIAANREVQTSPALPTMKYLIVDFLAAAEFDIGIGTARTVAVLDQNAAGTNPDVKVAIITSSALVRGMSSVYALYHKVMGGSWTTEIFAREVDARAWAVPAS